MVIEDLRLYIQAHELPEAEDRLYSAVHVFGFNNSKRLTLATAPLEFPLTP
jgi:hypothetical protein